MERMHLSRLTKGENPTPMEGLKKSYKESLMSEGGQGQEGSEEIVEDGDISDDDVVEEGDGITWFGMVMNKEEKIAAHRPGRNALIIKFIG